MSEYIEKVLHVKSEDLRLYSLSNEENPVHLDDETMTVADLKFTDGQKLLLESEYMYMYNMHNMCHMYTVHVLHVDHCTCTCTLLVH